MAAKVDICNLALSHLGIGKDLTDVDTDAGQEALACRRFYSTALEKVLRDYDWPFATVIEALALVEEDPNDEWAFSYRYPSGALKFRRILSGQRNDTRQSRVPYRLISDSQGRLILTDAEQAEGEYTANVTDPALYSPDFVIALSYLLGGFIAPRLTAGDPYKLGEKSLRMYEYEISKARANAANEEQPDELPDAEMIIARE
jgi:hypothetical protein